MGAEAFAALTASASEVKVVWELATARQATSKRMVARIVYVYYKQTERRQ